MNFIKVTCLKNPIEQHTSSLFNDNSARTLSRSIKSHSIPFSCSFKVHFNLLFNPVTSALMSLSVIIPTPVRRLKSCLSLFPFLMIVPIHFMTSMFTHKNVSIFADKTTSFLFVISYSRKTLVVILRKLFSFFSTTTKRTCDSKFRTAKLFCKFHRFNLLS